MTMEKAQLFFEDFLHKTADEFFALPQSGSSRKNYVGRSSDLTLLDLIQDFLYFIQN